MKCSPFCFYRQFALHVDPSVQLLLASVRCVFMIFNWTICKRKKKITENYARSGAHPQIIKGILRNKKSIFINGKLFLYIQQHHQDNGVKDLCILGLL